MGRPSAVFANVVILGMLLAWALLSTYRPEVYYQSVQEDAVLEWVTFWSFAMATVVFAAAAVGQFREGRVPWFLAGLGLFCFIFAMEEISWGQRVLGFRPPEYFLTKNYQQELNLHNLPGRTLRKAVFRAIMIVYGVVLPAMTLAQPTRRFVERAGIVSPPPALIPSFVAMTVLHFVYPWAFTGELIEATLGVAFMLAAFANYRTVAAHVKRPLVATLATAVVCIGFLGAGSAFWSQRMQASDPSLEQQARAETEALRRDLLEVARRIRKVPTKCGMHKRLYTFVEGRGYAETLRERSFYALAEDRGEYLIDPWNSPYWVRDTCDEATRRRSIFVYSFGPNRRRDSTEWEILGDDIGEYLRR